MRLVPTRKGKSRQFKKLIIPRLELMAVLIGVRAANFVRHELRINISEKYCGLTRSVRVALAEDYKAIISFLLRII